MKSNLKTVLIEHQGELIQAEVKSEYLHQGSSFLALETEEKELLHKALFEVQEIKATLDDATSLLSEAEQEEIARTVEAEMADMDWEEAREHLMKVKAQYEAARQGQFGLEKRILPLVKRLDAGDRSPELYEVIMNL